MRKIKSILMIALMAGMLFAGVYYMFFDEDDMQDAITQYEDGDYMDAMKILNTLVRVSDYENAEKMYYYRVKVIHAYARQLTDEYDEELGEITASEKAKKDVQEEIKEINEELDEINSEIQGDLALQVGDERSYIVSQGKLYEEFTSLYSGSRYIEDLDFEMMRKNVRLSPQNTMAAVSGFYQKYPDTGYLASTVAVMFENISRGDLQFKENAVTLSSMLIKFCVQYPTSSEYQRIYTCDGDNVNLRDTPGLEGGVVGKLSQDEICLQLEKSMDSMQLGDVRDYWYRIVSVQGKKGWIFGKFLKHIDVSKYEKKNSDLKWILEEKFTSWNDSHTPSGWQHLYPENSGVISFEKLQDNGVAKVNSDGKGNAGLFRRVAAFRTFNLQAKARLTRGKKVTLFALVVPGNGVYELNLEKDGIDVSGRRIPFDVTSLHVYELKSINGTEATLLVDGEIISARIKPIKSDEYPSQALYLLRCWSGIPAEAEIHYIRIR